MMKRITAFIIVAAYFLHCPYNIKQYYNYERKEAIVISKQVGEVVDAQEREQYSLFPGIENYTAATFRELMGGGFEIEITTGTKKLVAINRDSLAIEILRDYIERYDEVRNSKKTWEKQWRIVDYDTLGLPITQHEIDQVKNPEFWAGHTTLGCCLLGAIPTIVIALKLGGYDMWTSQMDHPTLYWLTLVGGFSMSILLGYFEGQRFDREQTLLKIKEARKPRVIK